MSDLHERLMAAVNARLRIAERCTPVNADAGYAWEQREVDVYDAAGVTVATNIGPMDAEHIAANDPATIIRHCERDLKVLRRHREETFAGSNLPSELDLDPDEGWCRTCRGSGWPCNEVLGLADAYDIPIDSALPVPDPVERGPAHDPPPNLS